MRDMYLTPHEYSPSTISGYFKTHNHVFHDPGRRQRNRSVAKIEELLPVDQDAIHFPPGLTFIQSQLFSFVTSFHAMAVARQAVLVHFAKF